MDTNTLISMTLCCDHHISLVQNKHGNLLGVNKLVFCAPVEECAWCSNDNLLLYLFASLHWAESRRWYSKATNTNCKISSVPQIHTHQISRSSSYFCCHERHMPVSHSDNLSPFAQSLGRSVGQAHTLVKGTGTESNHDTTEMLQLHLDTGKICSLAYVTLTWVHLLSGFTWLSMAKEKAAVLPVPDCDWAIKFWGLQPDMIHTKAWGETFMQYKILGVLEHWSWKKASFKISTLH